MKSIITFLFLLLVVTTSHSQNQYSSWNSFNIEKKVGEQWSILCETHLRRTNFLDNWQQFIVRPMLTYDIRNNLGLTLGYSYVQHYNNYQNTGIITTENNLFQQATFLQNLNVFSFNHRLRFEERWVQNITKIAPNSYVINGINYKNRFRYRFKITIPLKTISKKYPLNLVLYDEVHIDFGNKLIPQKIEQNWIFLGLSFRASSHLKLRTGYHDIYALRNEGFVKNHIWETTLTYKI